MTRKQFYDDLYGDRPKPRTNKVGFTEEQQKELTQIIGIVTAAARVVTESTVGTDEDIAAAVGELIAYIRTLYPRGPLQLAESLKNICEFCDLPSIIYAEYKGNLKEPIE